MKKSVWLMGLLAALLVCFGSFTGAKAADDNKTIHLKFSTWHPPVSREVKTVWIPMLEELKKRSNGRITYTLYAGAALGKGPEHYDIVKNGLSDMGYFTATWTPGRFPLTDVLSMASWVDGKDLAANIGNQVYAKALQDEFKGVKVLELNGCIQSFLWTTKPVHTLEDLKGLKIRTPRRHADRLHQGPGRSAGVHAPGRRVFGHGDRHHRRFGHLPPAGAGLQAL